MAGRQLYKACLGEAKRRVELIRQSRRWPKAHRTRAAGVRQRLFAQARQQQAFDRFRLISFATGLRASWLGGHLTSRSACARAYRAAAGLRVGRARRVRFKGRNQPGHWRAGTTPRASAAGGWPCSGTA